MGLKPHPLAEVFPMMNGEHLKALADDIAENGLREPIVLAADGRILDGRCRYAACEMVGVKPRTETFEGRDPVAFVVSMNLHRRHLTVQQRAMAAAAIANLANGQRPRSFDLGGHNDVSVATAASLLGVSSESVKRAKAVLRDGADEVIEKVRAGQLELETARKIAQLPKEEQVEELKKPRRFREPCAPEGKPDARFKGLPKTPASIAKPVLFKQFLKCGQELAWRFRSDPLYERMLRALKELGEIHEAWTTRKEKP